MLVSNFGNWPFHVPKHTVVGLSLPSPTHILTLGVSAPGEAEAKEGGGNKNNSSTATEKHARREQPTTDEDRIHSVRTEEFARHQGPVTDDGKIKSSTAAGECASREEPDTDDPHSGNPANADERTDTDAEKTRAWDEDVHIGAEDSTIRSQIIDMLSEFKDIWSGRLGKIDATKHRIALKPGARPIYQAPYRAGPIAREKEKKEIDRMLRAGVIEPTSAEWAIPVVFVPKKDETMGFCVDYRKLNAVMVRDSYPLPRMDECIDSLGDVIVFTTLDCNSGYWQVEIAEEDRDKTTFASHSGLYRFLRMPFSLKNAPAIFQRAVDIILSRVKWETALVYLDDVIFYSRTVTEHMAHVREVLRLLHTAGVSPKLAKCAFFDTSLTYLGHVIRPGRLEVERRNVIAIERARAPTNQMKLRSFLGMCNLYRRFIQGFAKIAAPLNKKTGKNQPYELEILTDAEFAAFEELKRRLVSPPVLALTRCGRKYTLDTDACGHQVGRALLQEPPEGGTRPVGYWSRALTDAERNYTTTEKECLAVVWGILTRRPYLYGSAFNLRTDHEALRWVLNWGTVPVGSLPGACVWRSTITKYSTAWASSINSRTAYRACVPMEETSNRSMMRSRASRSSTMRAARPSWTKCPGTCPKTVRAVVTRSRPPPKSATLRPSRLRNFYARKPKTPFVASPRRPSGRRIRSSTSTATVFWSGSPRWMGPCSVWYRLGCAPGYCTWHTIRGWQVTRERRVCTTPFAGSTTGHTWPATRFRPYGIALRVLRPAGRLSRTKRLSSCSPRRAP